jgi:GntR family transcriptional regulator
MFKHMDILKTSMKIKINHKSSIPLHAQVEDLFRQMIAKEEYRDGKMFPKEVDIARQLGISRNTVRQAISKLVMEGLLERKKGVGTKVAEQNISTNLYNWLSFTQEMTKQGIEFVNYKIACKMVEANTEVAQALEIPEGTGILKLSRLRGDENGPFVYFISWLHPRIGMNGKEDFTKPLYKIIEQDYSIVVELSREKIQAIRASKKIAEKLCIHEGDPVLYRVRKVYDPGNKPIEYNIGFYRSDKFTYSIDIRRETT